MIKIRGLKKEYAAKVALRGLDADVAPGEVCGLIGSNGAGKTTLLRILSTTLRPTAGEVSIAGYDLQYEAHQIRSLIGYMPDSLSTYEEIRVDTFLEFFAHLYDLPRETVTQTIGDILSLVDLGPLRHSLIETLSLGSRQRLSLGRVLLHNPEVLLLDEPVSGLDPRARVEMRALLKELGSMGKSVLISSHVLTDLVDLCDRLLIIEQGEKVFSGSFQELEELVAADSQISIGLSSRLEEAQRFLSDQRYTKSVSLSGDSTLLLTLSDSEIPVERVTAALAEAGYSITEFTPLHLDLEEAFLKITQGIVS